MQDLLEKLKNASQGVIPGQEGGDLLEKLRLASQIPTETEILEPRDMTKLPLEPEPSLLDKIKSMAAKVSPWIKEEPEKPPELERPEFPIREPRIRAATPAEKEFTEKYGTLYEMATQPPPERKIGPLSGVKSLLSGFYQSAATTADTLDFYSGKLAELGEKITGIPKEKLKGSLFEKLRDDWFYWGARMQQEGLREGFLHDILAGIGGAGFDIPTIMAFGQLGLPIHGAIHGGAEAGLKGAGLGAVRGALMHKAIQALGLLPSRFRLPGWAGFGATITPGGVRERAAGGITWAVLGLSGGNRRVTIEEFLDRYQGLRGKQRRFVADNFLRAFGSKVGINYEDIKEMGMAEEVLDNSLEWLQSKEFKDLAQRTIGEYRVDPERAKLLPRAADLVGTEEGVVYKPGEAKEPDLTVARYRAAEEKPIYPEVAPETEVQIDVTPKPGGGQTITIKTPAKPVEPTVEAPEKPVETRPPIETTPTPPAKVIKPTGPPRKYPPGFPKDAPQIWRDIWDVTNGKGIRPYSPDPTGKIPELEEYNENVPKVLRRRNKDAFAPDEVAQLLGLEGDKELYARLSSEKKAPTEEQLVTEEAAYVEQEAKEFKDKEQSLAGILYENEWINDKTSMLYTDEVKADLEGILDQSIEPGQIVKREGRKYDYSFGLNDTGDTLFVSRYKLPEPEQMGLGMEKPAIVKPEKPEVKEVKPRVPEFGEKKPEQAGIDFEESGKLPLKEKKEALPKTGEELTPEQKKALAEKYEDLGKTPGAEKEAPLPEAEKEKIPSRLKMVKISIEDPTGTMCEMGSIPVDSLKSIRSYAFKLGLSKKLKVGDPYIGKWKEHYSPKEHVDFVRGIIRDVKEVPAEEWKKWGEFFSGYPITKEIKRALDAIKAKHREKKAIKMEELKEELLKTDEGKVQWMYLESERLLKQKKKWTFKKAFRAAKRATIDTSGNIRKDLLSNLGDLGEEAMIRHDLIAGASSQAAKLYEDAEKKIYKGLSKDEENLLNWAIQSRRTIAISKYRQELTPEKEKGFWEDFELTGEDIKFIRHPHGLTGEQHQKWLDKEIPEKINKRADLYFKEMRKILDDYLDEGIITEEEHEAMSSKGVYSKRLYIKFIDPEETYKIAGKTITVPSSGIKALEEGSYDVMETNSRLLLESVIARSQGRIFRNRANKAAYEVAKQVPDNGIFIEAEEGKKAPAGHTRLKVMIDGEAKEMIMLDEYAREWIHRDPLVNDQMANWIGWFSGNKLLKAMATGLNPGFAFTNPFRDIPHLWIVGYKAGYSSFAPIFAGQIARDLISTFKDTWSRKGAWLDYLEEGGGMQFLTSQGRPFRTTRKVLRDLQKVFGYLGETSEISTRLAVRKRALRSDYDPHEATWQARTYLDFGQGGNVTKAFDTGIPYLNASIQATRGIFRAAKERPGRTLWIFAQMAGIATGLYLANRFGNKECWDSVSNREKINNFIITTPWMVKDKNGNDRHFYFKITKDQSQRVLCTIFENMMAKILGDEVDADQIVGAVKDFLPIIPGQKLPPVVDAFFGYAANYDTWTDQKLWKGGEVKPEKEFTIYTHPALVKAGEITKLSPERLKYALSQFFTRGNIYTSLVSGGFSLALGDMDKADRRKITAEVVENLPIVRRVFSLTPPYKESELRELEKSRQEEATRRHDQNIELSRMSNTYYRKLKDDKVKDRELLGEIKTFIREQPKEDRDRLVRWFRNYGIVYDIPERSWWLNLTDLTPEARAHVYWTKYLTKEKDEQRDMDRLAHKIPGLWSERFFRRLRILRAKWRKEQ